MSNLTSTVKFDVLRGWPDGAAVADSFTVKTGDTVKEGQLVQLSGTGTGVQVAKCTTTVPLVGTETAVPGNPVHVRMVIQGNDQYDGSFTNKAVVLRGHFTVKTEKFVAGSYAPGDLLTWVITGGSEGYLTKTTGTMATTTQIVGVVEEYDSAAGTLVAAMSL